VQTSVANDRELSLRDLIDAFRRNFGIFLVTFSVVFLLSILFCIVTTHRFAATGMVEVDRAVGDLDPQSLSGAPQGSSDALQTDIDLQTESQLLQSNILALRTIDALGLEKSPDFAPSWISLPDPTAWFHSGPPETAAQKEAATRAEVLRLFSKRLTVKADTGTRLLEVTYASQDANTAAKVVNELAAQLATYGYEQRIEATNADSKTLGKQLGELRTRSEELASKVASMQSSTGVYDLGQTDSQGKEQTYSAVLDRFQHAATELNDADQNRILKQAIADEASKGDAELLSSLAGNGTMGVSTSVTNSLATIEALRTQEATLQGQLDQLKSKFGPGYPPLQETQASIRGISKLIADETQRIRDRAKNDAIVANKTYEAALADYEDLKRQAQNANSETVAYIITRQEAEDTRTLYEDLLKKLNEAGILEQLRADRVTLVDPAIPPVRKTKPPYPLVVAGGFVGGVCLGVLMVLLANIFDDRVHTPSQIENSGISVLGLLVPFDGDKSVLSNFNTSYGSGVQAVKTRLGNQSRTDRVTLVSCSVPNRHKYMFSTTLGVAGARAGNRVVLVEADLRNGRIAERLGISNNLGLSSVLTGECSLEQAAQPYAQVPGLWVIPAGPAPANATELLAASGLAESIQELRSRFDVVILDGPPVLSAPADAALLSRIADVTVQLARFDVDTETSIKRANEQLAAQSSRPVGVLFTDVPARSRAFSTYYGPTKQDISAMEAYS
jgi:capsular exopolysaccharide synthesis family protein